jgi:hypothetical protein
MHRIYLGGDNSKQGERFPLVDVARVLVSQGVEGFTLIPATGYWQGSPEETWIIEISSDPGQDIGALVQYLKIVFKQDAIGLVNVGELTLV